MVNRAINIIVTNYNENWVDFFEKEAMLIRNIFKEELVDIHHIGSTSVPNIKAKPIIDILPVVQNIHIVDDFNGQMIAIGYEPLGEFGIQGRRFFRKGGENRTHHVHIFQHDNLFDIERHLAVRDYLRAHEEDMIAYGDLKEKLAHQYPKDTEGYSHGKNDFVKNLEQRAIQWKRANNN